MDKYIVIKNANENENYTIMKNGKTFGSFFSKENTESFLTLLVNSTLSGPAVDIDDDVYDDINTDVSTQEIFFDKDSKRISIIHKNRNYNDDTV